MSGIQALFNAVSGLKASRTALDTIAHNIANASTPNYSRQEVTQTPNSGVNNGVGFIGTGVQVVNVTRLHDEFLEEQLRSAAAFQQESEAIKDAYEQTELYFNELTDNDLSSSINEFWNSMQEMVANSDDISNRRAVITQTATLNADFQNLQNSLGSIIEDLDGSIETSTETINIFAERIASYNSDIIELESGGASNQKANDIRDARDAVMRELFELTDGFAREDSSGSVNVFVGGQTLVFRDLHFGVTTEVINVDGININRPIFEDGSRLEPNSGALRGFMDARDNIVPGIQNQINELAGNMIWEFNRVHSAGRGLTGFSSLTSTQTVDSTSVPLDEIDLGFTPVNGTFEVTNGSFGMVVFNKITGEEETHTIEIDLDNKDTLTQMIKLADLNIGTGTFQITDTDGNNYDIIVDNSFNNVQDVLNAINTAIDTTNDPATEGRLTARIVGNRIEIIDKINGGGAVALADTVGTVATDLFSLVDGNGGTTTIFEGQDLTAVLPVDNDMDLEDLANIINSIDNISAEVTARRQLEISADTSNFEFSFDGDSSGVLAFLGINTYFDGYNASTIGINDSIEESPALFAGATSGDPADNTNVLNLLALRDAATMESDTASFEEYYESLVSELALEAQRSENQFFSQELVVQNIEFERDQISGVSLDEEAANMIQYQRAFQAAARMISTVDELLQTLLSL